jgi:dipeptidyl-peptidase-4
MSGDTFPRQQARTRRFTLGEPRNLTVSPDGSRVMFLRSRAGDDPVNCLWSLDVASADERLVADPLVLLSTGDEDDLPPEERARRERTRETAGGITDFATDAKATVVAFALAGRLFVGGMLSGAARELVVDGPVFDPRPDPVATRVAYVSGRSLRIAELDGSSWELAGDEDPEVSWGSADFIAAEEMGRARGYWWSPDGTAIAACRVDVSPVTTWYIADPAMPSEPARPIRYPAAGTPNARVELHVLALDGASTRVRWDDARYPYLAAVAWSTPSRLLLSVQSRDQRDLLVLAANPTTGHTAPIFTDHDEHWVELVPGTPDELPDGRVVMTADREGTRRLLIDGVAVTPVDLQVRAVVGVGEETVTFQANALDDPTQVLVWRWSATALERVSGEGGVHAAAVGGPTTVLRSTT